MIQKDLLFNYLVGLYFFVIKVFFLEIPLATCLSIKLIHFRGLELASKLTGQVVLFIVNLQALFLFAFTYSFLSSSFVGFKTS